MGMTNCVCMYMCVSVYFLKANIDYTLHSTPFTYNVSINERKFVKNKNKNNDLN